MQAPEDRENNLVRLSDAMDQKAESEARPRLRTSKKREEVLRARRERRVKAAQKAELPKDLTRVFQEIESPRRKPNPPAPGLPVPQMPARQLPVPVPNTPPQTKGPGPAPGPGKGQGQGQGPGGKGPKAKEAGPKVIYIPPPTVGGARARGRHWGLLFTFFFFVLAPFAAAGWYLYEQAVDQYASSLGFSVRKEEAGTNFDGLSNTLLGDIGGSQSAADADVIYEFIQSQDLVERIDARLDLRQIYTKASYDPVFALAPGSAIEDLVEYWQRMVTIFYDAGSGLLEVRVLAFAPEDAQAINRAIFEESSKMINNLSAIARDDATRYAREDLERAQAQLREARVEITNFRVSNNIASTPEELLTRDNELLTILFQQLAEAEIELQILRQNSRAGDPRVRQGEQLVEVIQDKIAEEQAKFGTGDQAYAKLVGDYEELVVQREFAETAYLAAQSNYNAAVAEATRQNRYLAPHIPPTLAQTAEYPRREVLLALFGLILLMSWAIVAMLYYSIKDRR